MSEGPPIDAGRVIADLRELDRRTGGPEGARRVCWSEEWRVARSFLDELLAEMGLVSERDPAGNLWARLGDRTSPALGLGSHLDSVPAGGWLDGALGVMAALEVLRAWAHHGEELPMSLTLIDWADEEGSRFGRSLFGSSAFSGRLDPAEVAGLSDAGGLSIVDVLAENGVALDRASGAAERQGDLAAYLELHIEQGPVLEAEGASAAAVDGCAAVERFRLVFRGQTSHAGTTPMDRRHDAGLAAAETALRIEEVGLLHGGVSTTGGLTLEPGIVSAIAGEAELLVDLRHPEAEPLSAMLAEALDAARAVAVTRGCELATEEIWRIAPTRFDDGLVSAARRACAEVAGSDRVMTSGALHDAAEVARVRPAAMIFCPSTAGISHAAREDTPEPALATAIEAFGLAVNRVLIAGR
ncbi:MAG: Zn-dependent hydrolase [Solirubrobacterales bacterium]